MTRAARLTFAGIFGFMVAFAANTLYLVIN